MWLLGTWFNGGHDSAGLRIGFSDCIGLFQLKYFCDSVWLSVQSAGGRNLSMFKAWLTSNILKDLLNKLRILTVRGSQSWSGCVEWYTAFTCKCLEYSPKLLCGNASQVMRLPIFLMLTLSTCSHWWNSQASWKLKRTLSQRACREWKPCTKQSSHPPALMIKPNHHAHRRPQREHQLPDEGVNLSAICPG